MILLPPTKMPKNFVQWAFVCFLTLGGALPQPVNKTGDKVVALPPAHHVSGINCFLSPLLPEVAWSCLALQRVSITLTKDYSTTTLYALISSAFAMYFWIYVTPGVVP
jgi:hypothetical protein